MSLFSLNATFPPSLANNPLLGASVIMALMMTVLMCGRWIYEIVAANRSDPAPRDSYIGVARRVRLWLVWAALLAAGPRMLQLMLWRLHGPVARENLSVVAWVSTIICAALILYAWFLDKRLVTVERSYPRRYGHIPVERPSDKEKIKMAKVLVVVAVISLATTFVRPAPDAAHQPTAISHR